MRGKEVPLNVQKFINTKFKYEKSNKKFEKQIKNFVDLEKWSTISMEFLL